MSSKRILGIGLLFSLALLFAWSRIQVIELGYAVSSLQREVEALRQNIGLFKSELAKHLSQEALLALAKRHGMTAPRREQILFVTEP